MHCLGLKPTIYAEKMHRNLIFGTRLEAINNRMVGKTGVHMHKTNWIFKQMPPPHFCLKVVCMKLDLAQTAWGKDPTQADLEVWDIQALHFQSKDLDRKWALECPTTCHFCKEFSATQVMCYPAYCIGVGAGPAGPVLAGPLFRWFNEIYYRYIKDLHAHFARAYYDQTTSKVLPTPLYCITQHSMNTFFCNKNKRRDALYSIDIFFLALSITPTVSYMKSQFHHY